MISEDLVFFSFLYIKLFELGVEIALNHQSVVTRHKVNLLKFPLQTRRFERTDDGFALRICFYFFHLYEPLSLSVNCLNSKIYLICRVSLIEPIWLPVPETIYEEKLWIEVVQYLLTFLSQVLSPLYPVLSPPDLPSCRFLETLLVTTAFLVNHDKLEFAL